ncbi:F510_1955 family glycosylhydrolase [Cryobacterium tagatosivorans]|uniref:Exo-alpha-sialidase n=1 Tax=Cryobacterium tagatosivorans TaxID=1259199 RepID=A0A4R8UBA2_9MICO|nr:exo-alpha-sialidase [Cryobacterium tagatosivorans]TFB48149.1 exo-alpha-sialidase [Cryobacterium tagatosivorans]
MVTASNEKITRNTPRSWAAVFTSVAVATTITGCSVPTDGGQEPAAGSAHAFGHVHGIGINPATGAAFAATHAGVFELPALDADTVRASDLEGPIAGRAQDTMGFTMSGDTMFGSGHPDPAEEPALSPPNLGLITSTDNAATWETISLRGQTDFHDLALTQDGNTTRIYGYDESAGTVSISQDGGSTWAAGASLALRDLSADPTTPSTVYATTADGLAVSTDSAHTFTLVPGAPPLYLLDSLDHTAGGLIGVTVDGTVWVQSGTEPWTSTGTIEGETEALTYAATPTSRLLVANGRGIMASHDLGKTWRDLVLN